MRRLQIDLDSNSTLYGNTRAALLHAKEQGFDLKKTNLLDIAVEIRDVIGLKKCGRIRWGALSMITDTFIFTDE